MRSTPLHRGRTTRFAVALAFAAACTGRQESPPPSVATEVEQSAPRPAATTETPPPATKPPRAYRDARTTDVGIWSELKDQVDLNEPSWLDASASLVIANANADGFRYLGGVAVAYVGDQEPDIVVPQLTGDDRDADGIPDQLDVLIGAKKAAANNAAYGSPYQELAYPGGDVPRDEGVCTDTVVRAVRNAGLDLQKSLQDDIKRSPGSFRMVKTPNANIDHRRVKTLLPHFERQWTKLRPDIDDSLAPWLPGDVIFMQTMGDARPDHLGVVTDELGGSGAPLIINNWTDGYATSPMDVARIVPITHRFRLRSELSLPAPHGGVAGLLRRHGLTVPADSSQLLVVTGLGWNSVGGTLQRYERNGEGWRAVGSRVGVTLGASGLAAGRGVGAPSKRAPTAKREGDRRAPAGVFELGTAFGQAARPYKGVWPYRKTTSSDRFVDDPESVHYNSWQTSGASDDWHSAEVLQQYTLGVVVKHNMPSEPGAGSAIFLHTWQGSPGATLGCTAMDANDLKSILTWLDPNRRPLLVQVAGMVFGEAAE